jgi:periplasmic divalent cation tolerance protein
MHGPEFNGLMHEDETCQVIVTVGDREAALTLARSCVEGRLAACAQVGGPIRSVYRWQGEVEEADEHFVIFKTSLAGYPALADFVNDHHSYDVPEIICIPITQGNPAYLKWVLESTGD